MDSALACQQRALRAVRACGDRIGEGSALLNISTTLEELGEYQGALQAALDALQLKEEQRDQAGKGRVLNNLSLIYWRQNDLPRAIEMLERSIAIKRQTGDPSLSGSINGLAVLMLDAGRPGTAVQLLHQSMALQKAVRQDAPTQEQWSNLGLAYRQLGQLDSADVAFHTSLAQRSLVQDPFVEMRNWMGLAEVLLERGKYRQAGLWLDSSMAMGLRLGAAADIREVHAMRVRQMEGLGRPEEALVHYKHFHAMGDSLMNAAKDATMNALRVRYATSQKEKENAELRAAGEVAGLKAARDRWLMAALTALATAAGIGGWLVVKTNRNAARRREEDLEQRALRLQMNPHFLFNALNSIPGLYHDAGPAHVIDYVGHLSKYLRLVLESSRLRTMALADELELVEHYLRINAERRPGTFTWALEVAAGLHTERVAVPPMLIQPLVENALEHGLAGQPNGVLKVSVGRDRDMLRIVVGDNGIGREAAARRSKFNKGSSLGIDMVRKRIQLFHRRADQGNAVQMEDGTSGDPRRPGTVVTLQIALKPMLKQDAHRDRG